MSLLGRLRCFITGEHDRRWERPYQADGTRRDEGMIEWCPRCTAVFDVEVPGSETRTRSEE